MVEINCRGVEVLIMPDLSNLVPFHSGQVYKIVLTLYTCPSASK